MKMAATPNPFYPHSTRFSLSTVLLLVVSWNIWFPMISECQTRKVSNRTFLFMPNTGVATQSKENWYNIYRSMFIYIKKVMVNLVSFYIIKRRKAKISCIEVELTYPQILNKSSNVKGI